MSAYNVSNTRFLKMQSLLAFEYSQHSSILLKTAKLGYF